MRHFFVKQSPVILLVITAITLCLVGCSSEDRTEYPEYSIVENAELGCIELYHEGIVYLPYGGFYNDDFRG